MSDPKPFASLSPSLLARKGGAKPAMRPQIQPLQQFHEVAARQMEDLGWNDMGYDLPEPHVQEVEAPAVRQAEIVQLASVEKHPVRKPAKAEPPKVVRQQREIAKRIAAAAPAKAVAKPELKSAGKSEGKRRSALADGRRAAFTLRLDAERHLRLRLACTVGNRSAQLVVIDALDRLLGTMPELDEIAAQVRKRK